MNVISIDAELNYTNYEQVFIKLIAPFLFTLWTFTFFRSIILKYCLVSLCLAHSILRSTLVDKKNRISLIVDFEVRMKIKMVERKQKNFKFHDFEIYIE